VKLLIKSDYESLESGNSGETDADCFYQKTDR